MRQCEYFGGPQDGKVFDWPDDMPLPKSFEYESEDGILVYGRYLRDSVTPTNYDWDEG